MPKKADLSRMNQAIHHRGPDDAGVEIIGNVGLAQQRLAIIDLSPKGHQPMSYANGRFWITFNGEIYNFQELKERLERKKYRFTSSSDTEVMLAMYQEYGTKCVEYFNGMFAFVIYDKKEDVLFAARDRLGKKPFKYFFDGKTFAFASEIKALFTQNEIPKEIDNDAIASYIYWGFVPSPKTGFKNIFKLPPASFLLLHNGSLTIQSYWSVKMQPNLDRSIHETKKELRSLLDSAVSLRMISDVPIGAFLSGGVDSCIVTGIMSRASARPIRTFTVGSPSWGMDERQDAKISSEFHHTKHTQLEIHPKVGDELLGKIVRAYDEPFGDSSAIPSYYVSQLARKHVTVALNGDGGDENFFGYSNYTTLQFISRLAWLKLPASLIYQLVSPFASTLLPNQLYQRILRVSHLMSGDPLSTYPLYARGYTNGIQMNDMWKDHSNTIQKEMQKHLPSNGRDPVSSVLSMDLQTVLPDGLMTKIDIASMQWALEGRSPLLDYRLVEFAATIPLSLKQKHGETKWILKEACTDLIPEHIRMLPKRGFVLPVNEWMKTTLKKQFDRVFTDSSHQLFTVLDFATIQKMYTYHQDGVSDYSAQLWKFFMLAKWYDEFF